jgi:hypothetical protein
MNLIQFNTVTPLMVLIVGVNFHDLVNCNSSILQGIPPNEKILPTIW